MRRLLALVAFVAGTLNAATLVPIQLLNPAGSTSGQTIVSNGPSNPPSWVTGASNTVTLPLSGTWSGHTIDPTGATDSTLGIEAMVTANPNACFAELPNAKYSMNWIIPHNANNVCLIGQPGTVIYPWQTNSISDSAIQIGDGLGTVSGIYFKNVTISATPLASAPNPSDLASEALNIDEGVERSWFENTIALPGNYYAVIIGNDITNEPTLYLKFDGLYIDASGANSGFIAALGVYYGEAYAQAIELSNTFINGPSYGDTFDDDSVVVYFSNSWLSGSDGHGITLFNSDATPLIHANGTEFNYGGGSNVALTTYATDTVLGDYLVGDYVLNGSWVTSTPVTITGSQTAGTLSPNTQLYLNDPITEAYTNTATVGAVTINKPSGRVNMASTASTVVVTDSYAVSSANNIFVQPIGTPDATCFLFDVTPGTGSFTITTNAACTSNRPIAFLILGQ